MSWGAIYLMSERTLKLFCVLFGIIFLALSAWIWSQGELQANDSRPLILIPLLSSLVLLVGAATLRKEVLRVLVLFWFIGGPVALWLASTVGCAAGWFSVSYCQ